MHPDDVPIDAGLVRRLLRGQRPEWADLPLHRVDEIGTDNVLYRLGDDLVVRMPRGGRSALTVEKECRWLPRLSAHLPVAVPAVRAACRPAEGYPFPWAVYNWLPGERAAAERITDGACFARDLAAFVAALQAIDASEAPPPGEHNFFRGVPLAERDEATRIAIEALRGRIDHAAATRIWDAAMAASAWSGQPVWIHGDLDRQNLLVVDGRLSGVIDFGGLAAGDPACDLMVAWKVFDRQGRRLFRDLAGADDASWERGRGWACSQAVIALAYYTDETHPVLVRESTAWLAALADA